MNNPIREATCEATFEELDRRSIRTGCETADNRAADFELRHRGYVFNASDARWEQPAALPVREAPQEAQWACGAKAAGTAPLPVACPVHGSSCDLVCQHGTALDVHCCNCHSGFIFDKDHECPSLDLGLYRCKICGTRWLLWPDAIHGGGWNMLDKWQRPGSCCDNMAMGEQIEHLRDIPLSGSPTTGSEPPQALGQALALMRIRQWVDEGFNINERECGYKSVPGLAGNVAAQVWLHVQDALANEQPPPCHCGCTRGAHTYYRGGGIFTACKVCRCEAYEPNQKLPPGSEPPQDERLQRRRITEQDLQDILKEGGHRGDAFNIEHVRMMGLRMAFYPEELLALVQTFLDAEHTRALLRGTVEGWKARTIQKLPPGSEPTPPEGLSLESAARRILKTFEEDEAMGYRSRDRQFAIALLRKAFASSPAADRQEE